MSNLHDEKENYCSPNGTNVKENIKKMPHQYWQHVLWSDEAKIQYIRLDQMESSVFGGPAVLFSFIHKESLLFFCYTGGRGVTGLYKNPWCYYSLKPYTVTFHAVL